MAEAIQKCSECGQYLKIDASKGRNFIPVKEVESRRKGYIIIKTITRLVCDNCKKKLKL